MKEFWFRNLCRSVVRISAPILSPGPSQARSQGLGPRIQESPPENVFAPGNLNFAMTLVAYICKQLAPEKKNRPQEKFFDPPPVPCLAMGVVLAATFSSKELAVFSRIMKVLDISCVFS